MTEQYVSGEMSMSFLDFWNKFFLNPRFTLYTVNGMDQVMKLYLDLCVYNRPFDFQGQERVALETSAFIYLLEKIENSIIVLLCQKD